MLRKIFAGPVLKREIGLEGLQASKAAFVTTATSCSPVVKSNSAENIYAYYIIELMDKGLIKLWPIVWIYSYVKTDLPSVSPTLKICRAAQAA